MKSLKICQPKIKANILAKWLSYPLIFANLVDYLRKEVQLVSLENFM